MKDERKAGAALSRYVRLVAVIADEGWTNASPEVIEEQLGRPIVPGRRLNAYGDAWAAFGDAVVDVIAEALVAGVSKQDLVDCRGWLSHSDIRGYIGRAVKPSAYDYEPSWPQRAALKMLLEDVHRIAEDDERQADLLLKAARTVLRRWAKEIPAEPSEAALAQVATMWRDEHRRLFVEARAKFLRELDQKTRPKKST